MKGQGFRESVVQQCLRQLGAQFRTKELARHPCMLAGHPGLASSPRYNADVGKYLSRECADVKRIDVSTNQDGALWQNRLVALPEPLAGVDPPSPAGEGGSVEALGVLEIGPKPTSDDAFTARMRRHQSWYRAAVLRLPAGTGPERGSTRVLGSMLRPEDAALGRNFLTPEIYQVAQARLREGSRNAEPFRLLHNMLSSQPMCFNLFAPLVRDNALASRLLQAVPGLEVARVLSVAIEHAPHPAREYLADGTSFDAFIEYEHRDGRRAFVGIETKLTDTFSQTVCDTPAYRRWMGGPASPWRPDAAARVCAVEHNQLWRDHLLAIALRDHPARRYAHGALLLVRHPLDRSCDRVVAGYRELLVSDDRTFIELPLDRLVDLWRVALDNDEQRAWLHAFRQRYLALEASEEAR